MHPLITAEGKRKRDFVLAAGKNSVQLFKKKICHSAFKLCNDVYSNQSFLGCTLLFSLNVLLGVQLFGNCVLPLRHWLLYER